MLKNIPKNAFIFLINYYVKKSEAINYFEIKTLFYNMFCSKLFFIRYFEGFIY